MTQTDTYKTQIVLVDINEIIGNDLEGFLNLLEERCGEAVLSDISYDVIGVQDGALQIKVSAYHITEGV